jgi:hypothetical protein
MVIYGIRARHKSAHRLPGPCSHCGTEGSVELNIFQRYAHVFWIPLFPVGRLAQTGCEHCKEVRSGKGLHAAEKLLYRDLAKDDRTPVWMFSGVLLVGILIPLAFWQSGRNDLAVRARLQAPMLGDVYQIKLDNSRYTIFKVVDVSSDSVGVLWSTSETNKLRGLTRLKAEGDAAYGDEEEAFSLADLQRMRDNDVIFAVDRSGE